MRLAAISDIHGNILALEAVLADIARRGVDLIVNLGDVLSGPLEPAATAERLMALELPTLRGNHERQLLACMHAPGGASDQFAFEALAARPWWPAARSWLEGLPHLRALGDDVFLCHGSPRSDVEYLLETVTARGAVPAARVEVDQRVRNIGYSLILCGHSHMPRAAAASAARLVANPGSVGLPAFDDDHGHYHVMECGSPHARYLIAERRGGLWVVDHHLVEYDWHRAAGLAARRGQLDWARWLATGRALADG